MLISSGGGSVDAAIEMGRMVRAKGLDVSVARTLADASAGKAPEAKKTPQAEVVVVDGGAPTAAGSFCASACPLLLAAGKARHVALYARVGLHKMVIPAHDVTQVLRFFQTRTLTLGKEVISKETRVVGEHNLITHVGRQSSSEQDYRKVVAYLDEMGLPSAKIVEYMHKASPDGMVWMSRKGLAETSLATDSQMPDAALGLAPKVAAPAPGETLSAGASRFSLTIRQFGLLSVILLATLAAMFNSFRRGGWSRGTTQRRDPPPL